ncbi:MAG TPA: hypothetical protein ENI37_01190 [Chloroflexi bacterium]|nr:hypothetical protein [Chloroflexota bacterium]
MSDRFRIFLPFISWGREEDPPEVLCGKGIWARPRPDPTSELERAIEIAQQVGATHVLYKVAHGADYFVGSIQAAQRIADAGLTPLGWMWLLLDDPAGEAQAAARAFEDGFQGLVFDTEDVCSGKSDEARTLARAAQDAHLDLTRLYNCSFPNILHHRDLPYDELNEICRGGLMPMAYGSFFAPGDPTPWEDQARRVIDEWTYGHYETWCGEQQTTCPPLHPVLGPYHDEYGGVQMGPEEFQVWLERLAAHGPTFVSVFTATVIGDALLPLIRDFPLGGEQEKKLLLPETVWIRLLEGAVLHENADPASRRLQAVIYGTGLRGLSRRKGADGRLWLQVRAPDSRVGWVPEDHLAPTDPGPPPSLPIPSPAPPGQLTHVWTEQEVNYRDQPVVQADTLIGRLYPGARMRILEDPALARTKVGVPGQWLNVQLEPEGPQGWVAAWYVTDRAPTQEEPSRATHVCVQSKIGLNLRATPSTSGKKTWHVPDGTVLEVLEDHQQAAKKIGVQGRWIRVRTPSLHEGHVASWLLSGDVPPDNRQPVADTALPFGECAWIFGIHGVGVNETADFRHLFHGSGKTGWVLFTESIGCNPNGLGSDEHRRNRLWEWARGGYGIIIRLNYGYHTAGTLPEPRYYEGFAATCARYAELYLKHPEEDPRKYTWIITIGNEQNNPREWPREGHPPEPITCEQYARAFNLAYRAIKAVLPNVRVVPGAVDPYNAELQRPLDYFVQMLAGIEELDGLALHTYTHGPDVNLITALRKFTDDPIKDHYYDFQAYRPFVEVIPSRWRDSPVYITETNHWTKKDGSLGWEDRNIGWVQAAYKEIHRWNSAPHAQQIHCLLLYRWQGDEWAIDIRDQVQADFRKALSRDYRWRR